MTQARGRRSVMATATGVGAAATFVLLGSAAPPAVAAEARPPGEGTPAVKFATIGPHDPAAWLFQAPASEPSSSPSAQQLAADGYSAASAGDKAGAAQKLKAALEAGGLPADQARTIRLTLSDLMAQLGQPAESVAALAPLASEQSYDVQARRGFALEAAGQKAEAAEAFLTAETHAPNADARLLMAKGRIYALVGLQRRADALAAITSLDQAGALPSKDAVELAYIAITYGDDGLAERLFARADALHQLSGAAALDAGYTARRAHHEARALAYFKAGLASLPAPTTPAEAQTRFQLEREVAELSRRWGVYAAMLYDNTNSVTASLPRSGSGNLQAGFEAYYRPLGYNAGRPLELFVRAFETLSSKRGDPTGGQTVQGWVGVRDKPFASQNLVLEASRVFKIGKTSRDDWMLRAGYSATGGLDLRQDHSSWPMRHVFLDIAHLIDSDETFVVAEGRLGWSYKVGSQLIVAPFLGASVAYDSGLADPTAVGVGPGLWFRPWFRSGDHVAPQSYVDLVLQYRARVAGDRRAEGFLTTLSLSY